VTEKREVSHAYHQEGQEGRSKDTQVSQPTSIPEKAAKQIPAQE